MPTRTDRTPDEDTWYRAVEARDQSTLVLAPGLEFVYRLARGAPHALPHRGIRAPPLTFDPLGPNNVLVFTTSVINGLSLSGTNRYTAAAKEAAAGQK